MKTLYAAALIPLIAACTPAGTSTSVDRIVNTVTPEGTAACVAAGAEARGVPQALVTTSTASAMATGPALSLNVNGEMATCKLNADGEVTSVTFP